VTKKTISSFVLGLAFMAPLALRADDDDHRHERDRQRTEQRYYDENARDYHVWNNREDQAYRNYLKERNREYREFSHANKRDQQDYWRWRHSHQDRDDDRR
jgi:hypothetical protein